MPSSSCELVPPAAITQAPVRSPTQSHSTAKHRSLLWISLCGHQVTGESGNEGVGAAAGVGANQRLTPPPSRLGSWAGVGFVALSARCGVGRQHPCRTVAMAGSQM